MAPNPFRSNVTDLLKSDAAPRPMTLRVPVDWGVELSRVAEEQPLEADLTLHPLPGGILATGSVRYRARHLCYRCLSEFDTDAEIEIRQLFERDPGDETYPLVEEELDLEQMLRDEVLLSMPISPVCRGDCEGVVTVPESDLNTVPPGEVADSGSPFSVLRDLLDSE